MSLDTVKRHGEVNHEGTTPELRVQDDTVISLLTEVVVLLTKIEIHLSIASDNEIEGIE